MGKIAFLVHHAPSVQFAKEVLASYEQVHVEYCQIDDSVNAAAKLAEQGYEIIVARGGMAADIRASGLNLTVVELLVSGFDLIRAIESAKNYGTNIGVVALPSMVRGIDCLTTFMGVLLKLYPVGNASEVETKVFQAAQEGVDVVIGGGLMAQAAKKHGLPSVVIDSGQEAFLHAAEEALRLERATEVEKIKRSLFAAVLDNVHDGIVTVDDLQKITSINMRAQQILKITSAEALGREIGTILPELSASGVVKKGREEFNKILQVKGLKVITSQVPIVVEKKQHGVLLTLQEITKIQQAEARIRQEVFNKGHVARMTFNDVLGRSDNIRRTIVLAKKYALTDSNILITGETGTGKEVFAQSIHNHSPRRAGPFVAVNCAALPGNILESELFGYVGGAFTGASKEGKPGLFELAHGGTVFLDEIAEMGFANQSRLLRVLQERSVMRLGSDRVISVDVRIISATNQELKELIQANKFRRDLFFRLNVLKLELSPLRTRRQDIRIMAESLVTRHSPKRKLTIAAPAIRVLESYEWPGNVRELQNTIERLMAFCQTKTIRASDIEAVLEEWESHQLQAAPHAASINEIRDALDRARGVKSDAAKLLGIDRSTLWRRMQRLGIRYRKNTKNRVI